jgi:hypothetical protein
LSDGSDFRYEAVLPRLHMSLDGQDNDEHSISPELSANVISFVLHLFIKFVFFLYCITRLLHGHNNILFIRCAKVESASAEIMIPIGTGCV